MSLSEITPIRRLENFLQDIADGKSTPTKTPITRLEEFFRRIAKKQADQDAKLLDMGFTRHKYQSVNLGSISFPAITSDDTFLGAANITAFRSKMIAASTVGELAKIIENNLKIYVNGIAFTSSKNYTETTAPPSQLPVNTRLYGLQTVNGNAVYMQLTATITKSGNTFISFTPKLFKATDNSEISENLSTGTNFKIDIYM